MLLFALLVFGCATCPEGFERGGGACQPNSSTAGPGEPLDAESFPDAWDATACEELEDCVQDALCEDPDCEVDVDCDGSDWSWSDGCTFDQAAAEDCLDNSNWTCDDDGDEIWVTAPSSCELVFSC